VLTESLPISERLLWLHYFNFQASCHIISACAKYRLYFNKKYWGTRVWWKLRDRKWRQSVWKPLLYRLNVPTSGVLYTGQKSNSLLWISLSENVSAGHPLNLLCRAMWEEGDWLEQSCTSCASGGWQRRIRTSFVCRRTFKKLNVTRSPSLSKYKTTVGSAQPDNSFHVGPSELSDLGSTSFSFHLYLSLKVFRKYNDTYEETPWYRRVELISLWLYKENNKLRDWKKMYLLYTFPLSSTHLWLCCSNFFNPSKTNSFGCAAYRKVGTGKSQQLISSHMYIGPHVANNIVLTKSAGSWLCTYSLVLKRIMGGLRDALPSVFLWIPYISFVFKRSVLYCDTTPESQNCKLRGDVYC
jgi:hypothetical protein